MSNFMTTFIIIAAGLAGGYFFKNINEKKSLFSEETITEFRKILQKTALLVINPIAFLGAVWVLPLENIRLLAFPFIGLAAIIAGGILGLAGGRILRLSNRQRGAFFCCSSFTNIGNLGGLFVFIILGETAYAFVPFYKLFEELIYYTTGFSIARSFAGYEETKKVSVFKKIFTDPFIVIILLSVSAGILLNLSGISRPDFFSQMNRFLIPISSFILLFSIGLAMRISRFSLYFKESGLIILIKSFLVPVFTCTLAYFAGFHMIDGGLPFKVVMVLSAMPSAFNALVPPTLYDLDIDLANTGWFFSTLSMVVVIPLLIKIMDIFPFF